MTTKNKNIAGNILEARIYECLGVKYFKNLILKLEKIRHGKAKGRNDNYHPHDLTSHALVAFSGHLYYNTLLHSISIVLLTVYLVLSIIFSHGLWYLTVVAVIFFVIDVYCIMLQRYTFLKIRRILYHRREKFKNAKRLLLPNLQNRLSSIDKNELYKDLQFLYELQRSFTSGETFFITEHAVESLRRLGYAVEGNSDYQAIAHTNHRSCNNTDSLTDFSPYIHSRTNLRVSKLQKRLGISSARNVHFGFFVVAETLHIECLFCSVFSTYSRDKLENAVTLLITAYTNTLKSMEG